MPCDTDAVQSAPNTILRGSGLVLTPLRVTDAESMVPVLADNALYRLTGGTPPDLEELTSRYRAQVLGPSTADHAWYNWIIRPSEDEPPIGFVQATVEGRAADLAWLVGTAWQGRGFATEAARAMLLWLADNGVNSFTAHIHPLHVASERVASANGLGSTGTFDQHGEVVWAGSA